jgi:flavodoxin I
MSKIGLFFGPEKGSVHRVAEKVKAAIGEQHVEMISVNDAVLSDLEKYDQIIFGISTVGKETWDSNYSNTDWRKFFPNISKVDFSGKTVAIFGLGDHITYSSYFVNAMGMLAKETEQRSWAWSILRDTNSTSRRPFSTECLSDFQSMKILNRN